MCLEKFVRPLLVRAHQTRIACHVGGEDRGETAFDGLLHSFLQQRRTEQKHNCWYQGKSDDPAASVVSARREPPPAANRPRAADKMRCSSALGPTPRPRYEESLSGEEPK